MTRSWPVAGLIFAGIWVFVRGPSLASEPVLGEFLIGLAVGVPVAYVFRRLYSEGLELRRSLRGVPYAVLYVLTFVREAIVSSIDVTYRVLAPSQPIEPEVILVPLRVRTDLGVTTIANSITMTPGTLTLDYDPEENALYLHVIDGRDPETIVKPIRNWEDYALIIFDEPLSPGDPAPNFAVYPPDRMHPVLEHAVTEPADSGVDETGGRDESDETNEPHDADGREADGENGGDDRGR